MRSVFVLWVALFLVTLSGSALAQSTAEKFATAVDLFVDGKCDAALPMFREVHENSESPNARLYIARCLEQLGDIPAAYDEMKATVNDATARAAKEPKYAKTRDAAAAELAVLRPRIATVVVAIADTPDGATAEVNGKPVPLGTPFAAAPGALEIVVRAPGYDAIRRELDVAAGATETVALTFGEPGTSPAPDPPPGGGADEASGPGLGTIRIAGIVVAGVGAIGMVVFAITGSMAQGEFDDLVAECNDTACPDSEAERVADGRQLTTVANVSAVIGGVALLAGAAMIIFGGPDDADETASATTDDAFQVTPIIGPTFVGVAGTFQ